MTTRRANGTRGDGVFTSRMKGKMTVGESMRRQQRIQQLQDEHKLPHSGALTPSPSRRDSAQKQRNNRVTQSANDIGSRLKRNHQNRSKFRLSPLNDDIFSNDVINISDDDDQPSRLSRKNNRQKRSLYPSLPKRNTMFTQNEQTNESETKQADSIQTSMLASPKRARTQQQQEYFHTPLPKRTMPKPTFSIPQEKGSTSNSLNLKFRAAKGSPYTTPPRRVISSASVMDTPPPLSTPRTIPKPFTSSLSKQLNKNSQNKLEKYPSHSLSKSRLLNRMRARESTLSVSDQPPRKVTRGGLIIPQLKLSASASVSTADTIPTSTFYRSEKHPLKLGEELIKRSNKNEIDDLEVTDVDAEIEVTEDKDSDDCLPSSVQNRQVWQDTFSEFEKLSTDAEEITPVQRTKEKKRTSHGEDIRFKTPSSAEMQVINSLTRRAPKDRVLATIKQANIDLKADDFSGLRASRWLNDEIINSFVALLNERNQKNKQSTVSEEEKNARTETDEKESETDDEIDFFDRPRPRMYMFNTFFFERIHGKGYDYDGVKRWLKRAKHDIRQLDLVLIPVNLSGLHWVLAAVDIRGRQFLYFDSLYESDKKGVLRTLRDWLKDEVEDKHGKEVMEEMRIDTWKRVINPDYVPQQTDTGSCGIFTLYIAEYLERGRRPDFTQKTIRTLRQRTTLFLKNGTLPES